MTKCKNCGDKFEQYKFNFRYCKKDECRNVGIAELLTKQRKAKDKKKRLESRKAKESLLTHKDYLKLLQTAFNAYIRKRDEGLPCISCGKDDNSKQYHAGHYRSVGSCPELRFEESNVHKQCAKCNNYLHGNLIEYRIALVNKIGLEKVQWLESNHPPTKLSIPEIKDLISEYKQKIKEIDSRESR